MIKTFTPRSLSLARPRASIWVVAAVAVLAVAGITVLAQGRHGRALSDTANGSRPRPSIPPAVLGVASTTAPQASPTPTLAVSDPPTSPTSRPSGHPVATPTQPERDQPTSGQQANGTPVPPVPSPSSPPPSTIPTPPSGPFTASVRIDLPEASPPPGGSGPYQLIQVTITATKPITSCHLYVQEDSQTGIGTEGIIQGTVCTFQGGPVHAPANPKVTYTLTSTAGEIASNDPCVLTPTVCQVHIK